MGGFDKAVRCRALMEHGWIEIEDNMLVPPDSLWQEKPISFYVYDAIELQGYLGNPKKMSSELKEYCGFDGDD